MSCGTTFVNGMHHTLPLVIIVPSLRYESFEAIRHMIHATREFVDTTQFMVHSDSKASDI